MSTPLIPPSPFIAHISRQVVKSSKRRYLILFTLITLIILFYSQSTSPLRPPTPFIQHDPYNRTGGHLFYPNNQSQQDTLLTPHPIHLLIDQAKRNWTAKLDKQSKSLHHAIDEYERRYGMRPPKGTSLPLPLGAEVPGLIMT